MNIVKMLISESKWAIKAPYEMKAESITVHNTANDATARNEIAYMERNNNKTSFHVAIDNTEIIEAIPFNRTAWHAGDGRGAGNMKSIGIEICFSKSNHSGAFDDAERLASKYIAKLLKDFGWGIDRVKKHQDWSGKYCPHRTLDKGWDRFLNMIISELNNVPGEPEKPQELVRRQFNKQTNIRNQPTINSSQNWLYKANTTVEILDQNVSQADGYNWDRVKSIVTGREGYVASNNRYK